MMVKNVLLNKDELPAVIWDCFSKKYLKENKLAKEILSYFKKDSLIVSAINIAEHYKEPIGFVFDSANAKKCSHTFYKLDFYKSLNKLVDLKLIGKNPASLNKLDSNYFTDENWYFLNCDEEKIKFLLESI